MAVTRRGYIFGAFIIGVLSVLLVLVTIASDSWVVATATAELQVADSNFRYGLFRGQITLQELGTPNINTLYMTCISELNACALSCKTDEEARQIEVRALAEGFRPTPACLAVTDVDTSDPLDYPPVISYVFYVCILTVLFLQLGVTVVAAGLAIVNATKNPTEPIFGLPGCLWANATAAGLGSVALLMFGIYWALSGLREHLAISYIALGLFEPSPGLGFSYWVLITSILCSLVNIGLIQGRAYLLEKDPPPPTIKVDSNSDGTIFLY